MMNQRFRYVLFLLAVALGIGLGLYYGLVISPVKLVDSAPVTLRLDYKSDFVLMVAESYSVDHDSVKAACKLMVLGYSNPQGAVSEAIVFGASNGYTATDLSMMRELESVMGTWNSDLESCE